MAVTFPVVWDGLGDVSRNYGVRALPTTFFIDRDGSVRNVVSGGLDLGKLEETITLLEPSPP